MRVVLRFFALFAPLIALTLFGSLKLMDRLERAWVENDLNRRSVLIQESVQDYVLENLASGKVDAVSRLFDRISSDERLLGLALCSKDGKLIARSKSLQAEYACTGLSELADGTAENFVDRGNLRIVHRAIQASAGDGVEGVQPAVFLTIQHDMSYMGRRHESTKRYFAILVVALALLFLGIAVLVHRWSRGDAIRRLGTVFKDLLSGEVTKVDARLARGELSPLARDLTKVMRELRIAQEAARTTGDSQLTWDPERLRAEVKRLFGDSPLCIIANREPYVHNRKGNKIEVLQPASGLVTAVEPIVRACSGLWIAHGSGSADRETADEDGKLLVPPGNPEYVLKRIWLSKAEEQGYYYGFSNEGLWPLCHIAHARPHFEVEHWEQYIRVNQRFAESFAQEKWDETPIVLIQDYHFAPLPKMVRELRPDAVINLFWHIPWPNPEAFGICPWKRELLEGMLGADVIGFHTQFHCNNFLDTVDRFLEARVDRENFSITIQGHTCYVKPFAISVEWPSRHDVPLTEFSAERAELLAELDLPSHIKLGIGVDRVDYTKGIVERLEAVERLLDLHPEWIGKFTFVQIGAPSRTHIKRYKDLNSEVQEVADRINWKFASLSDVPPIILRLAHHPATELFRYYRAAEICFVSSLHDGMNLVAKEYIAAHGDQDGVLILSNFTGASKELTEALLVNPYDRDECAAALQRALTMPEEERSERMKRLRATVSERNVYAWAAAMLAETHRIAQAKSGPLNP